MVERRHTVDISAVCKTAACPSVKWNGNTKYMGRIVKSIYNMHLHLSALIYCINVFGIEALDFGCIALQRSSLRQDRNIMLTRNAAIYAYMLYKVLLSGTGRNIMKLPRVICGCGLCFVCCIGSSRTNVWI